MFVMNEPKKKKRQRPPKPLTPEQRAIKRQTKVVMQRCTILSIKPIDANSCLVWGGESEHIVTFEGGLIKCDCKGWANAHNHNCSHVMKYRLVYGDLKK